MSAETALIEAVRRCLLRALDGAWTDASYAGGAAGQLLSLAVLEQRASGARGSEVDRDWMAESVARLLERLPRYPHGLFQGAQGLLFAALELDRVYGLGLAEEAAQDADEYLLDCLRADRDLPYHFDLISGIAGLLTYAAYREQQGSRLPLVEACVARLHAMATATADGGVFWFTPPAWIRGFPMGDAHPGGCTDLGVAHGQAGVLAALAYALAVATTGRDQARELLLGGLRYLRRQEQSAGHAHFGTAAESADPARCAWCYGDLGTAAALRLAATALDDAALDAWADRLLQTLGRRPLQGLGFIDAWLCHGSAGSAWLMQQLAPKQLQPLVAHCLQLHPLQGETGLLAQLERAPAAELSLLEGYAGLALVLSEGQSPGPPAETLHWSLPFLAGRRALSARILNP